MNKLLLFLNELETKNIYYRLNKVRDSILVEVVVPGQRWEMEFFDDRVEIEKFVSTGVLYGEEEIAELFLKYSD